LQPGGTTVSLTPEEIVDADLKLALRGYATDQVDDLLDRLADTPVQQRPPRRFAGGGRCRTVGTRIRVLGAERLAQWRRFGLVAGSAACGAHQGENQREETTEGQDVGHCGMRGFRKPEQPKCSGVRVQDD
jgi:DivIVA domain-containing protein